jgi:hypothetical protein
MYALRDKVHENPDNNECPVPGCFVDFGLLDIDEYDWAARAASVTRHYRAEHA